MPFLTFLNSHGVKVIIERNGKPINTEKGLFNATQDTHRKYCGFLPKVDIKPGDWIINTVSNERFYIEDTQSQMFCGSVEQIKAFYQTETEYSKQSTSNNTVFNIQNAYGSVIGTGNTATINYQNSIEEIRKTIDDSDSSDKEELQKIVNLLEMIINEDVPAKKGLFSRFSKVMEENSWITGSVASAIMSWLLSQCS